GQISLQNWHATCARCHAHLYAGRGAAAWEHVNGMWGALKAALLFRVQNVHLDAIWVRARSALAAAAATDDPSPLLPAAAADARWMRRTRVSWAVAAAKLVEGGVAAARGDLALSGALFGDAERVCEAS